MIKTIFIGGPKTGKSFVAKTLTSRGAPNDRLRRQTIGVDVNFFSRQTDGKVITYNIFEIAGSEKCSEDCCTYYQGGQIVIVFEGGDDVCTPDEWEDHAKKSIPKAKYYRVSGTLEEKRDQVLKILS